MDRYGLGLRPWLRSWELETASNVTYAALQMTPNDAGVLLRAPNGDPLQCPSCGNPDIDLRLEQTENPDLCPGCVRGVIMRFVIPEELLTMMNDSDEGICFCAGSLDLFKTATSYRAGKDKISYDTIRLTGISDDWMQSSIEDINEGTAARPQPVSPLVQDEVQISSAIRSWHGLPLTTFFHDLFLHRQFIGGSEFNTRATYHVAFEITGGEEDVLAAFANNGNEEFSPSLRLVVANVGCSDERLTTANCYVPDPPAHNEHRFDDPVQVVVLKDLLLVIVGLVIAASIYYVRVYKCRTDEQIRMRKILREVSNHVKLCDVDSQLDCCICLERLTSKKRVRELKICKHYIHGACLSSWIKSKEDDVDGRKEEDERVLTCPLCRVPMREKDEKKGSEQDNLSGPPSPRNVEMTEVRM
mmetsp:Transcript_12096/g.24572  ORF Transcript_12096/g.24572 Transcript_12096/m.24572 type:complete len:415 (+) Transcript_12096:226-1470(+)|eukprot:CAMPEP_0197548990 /NCGR_PEP_ID=MMETSP1320-20131121/2994_1 /TAXON_ID=91990 /ORGANISM="Bolidomonas sp., Strain RCC2347" /LENGTH=414 /DNA_ID=CAMNT_0043109121 /DNA_START=207 /DNA_END=1451 /DNA_ORIENTATION=+